MVNDCNDSPYDRCQMSSCREHRLLYSENAKCRHVVYVRARVSATRYLMPASYTMGSLLIKRDDIIMA